MLNRLVSLKSLFAFAKFLARACRHLPMKLSAKSSVSPSEHTKVHLATGGSQLASAQLADFSPSVHIWIVNHFFLNQTYHICLSSSFEKVKIQTSVLVFSKHLFYGSTLPQTQDSNHSYFFYFIYFFSFSQRQSQSVPEFRLWHTRMNALILMCEM